MTVKKRQRTIGLFGGSFDPPHRGHRLVIADLLQKNIFDEIWLLPVYQHPFAKKLTDFSHRVEMLRLLKETINDERLSICLIEQTRHCEKNYTHDTVQDLLRLHPDCTFSLIVGSDVKNDLPKWHKIDQLKKIATFYFIPRKGLADSPYPQISSTEIREHIKNSDDISTLVDNKIRDYIALHHLYT